MNEKEKRTIELVIVSVLGVLGGRQVVLVGVDHFVSAGGVSLLLLLLLLLSAGRIWRGHLVAAVGLGGELGVVYADEQRVVHHLERGEKVDVARQLVHEEALHVGPDGDAAALVEQIVVLERGRVLLLLLDGGGAVHRRALDVVLAVYLVLGREDVAHDEHVVLLVLDGESEHAEQVGQQRVAARLHDVLVIAGEHVVEALDVLAGDRLDDVALVVGDVELGVALAAEAAVERLDVAARQRLLVRLVGDVEALAHVLEHERTVLLDLVVAGQHVLVEVLVVDLDLDERRKVVRHQQLRHADLLEFVAL